VPRAALPRRAGAALAPWTGPSNVRSTPIGLDGTNDEVFWSILRLGQRMLHHELRGHRPTGT